MRKANSENQVRVELGKCLGLIIFDDITSNPKTGVRCLSILEPNSSVLAVSRNHKYRFEIVSSAHADSPI